MEFRQGAEAVATPRERLLRFALVGHVIEPYPLGNVRTKPTLTSNPSPDGDCGMWASGFCSRAQPGESGGKCHE